MIMASLESFCAFKAIFLTVILLLLLNSSSCTKHDQLSTMVEGAHNHPTFVGENLGKHSKNGSKHESWNVVGKKGHQFVLNGKPFYVNGFNTYWLMVIAANPSTRGKVTSVFQQASSVGLTVGRTWAFNDGQDPALQKSPGVYDENVFKGLDFVVSEAKKHKIRLMLSLVNSWADYGGKKQYVKWGNDAGLKLASEDDFFTHQTIKGYYKAHVKTVLNRVNTFTKIAYKDDPTIFAWELINEPRCTADPSGNKVQAWIQEMATYVKSIDPKHLVEMGMEGFYGPPTPQRTKLNPNTAAQQVGTDFIRNHKVSGIDFASVHIYPDVWISKTISDDFLKFTKSWVEAHIEDAEKSLGMPVLFAEFGLSSKDIGFNTSFRDKYFETIYTTLLNSAKKRGSGGGSLFWQLFPEGTDNMDDGNAIVLSKSPATAKIISDQSKSLALINNH